MTTMCVFCQAIARKGQFLENERAVAFPDGFPLSPGHTLIVPRRHETDFFALSRGEQAALWSLVPAVRNAIERTYNPTGYNVGVNSGTSAGQTIDHIHIHVIPRYPGDVKDPRGGVRWVIPDRAAYWEEQE
ncbi:MAG: HIT family hydrolase [Gemmatimonas sp. SG8_17]|nr:MAG: HIT family hydrolase [Gemmatimonas sp. SG8_17]